MNNTSQSLASLDEKNEAEITTYLEMEFGYQVQGNESLSKEDLIAIAKQLYDNREKESTERFVPFQHLSKEVDLTERMLSEAFHTSFQSFAVYHIINKNAPIEDQKNIYYQIRDIAVSNNIRIVNPRDLPKDETVRKVIPSSTAKVKAPTSKKKATNGTTPSGGGKGKNVNQVIDTLIEEGLELSNIKPRNIMDKFMSVFNESVSNGYAYNVLNKRKKAANV